MEDEIKQKLTDNGLGNYIPAFEQNHLLDEDVLASMTDSDYVSVGVTILGDRKKLLLLFKKAAAEKKNPASVSESNSSSVSASESVPPVSASVAISSAASTSAQALPQLTESYFDGGFWQLLGWELLGWLVTVCTAGICYPFAVCWLYGWEAKHTVIDGRRLKFTGTAGGLFGTWILCLLLSFVTCGIYSFWIPIKIKKWQIKHTHFADNLSDEEKSQIEKQAVKIDREKACKIGGLVAAAFLVIWLISFCVGRFAATSVSAEKAVDYIYSLSHDATVKVKGEISKEELSYIFEAINDGNHKVDLDLSKTSGLKDVYGEVGWIEDIENLRSIKFSKDTENIYGFNGGDLSGGEDLQNVELPEGVITIEGFENCRKIKSIYIPSSVKGIYGFTGCSSLESIKVASGNSVYSGEGNCIFEKESGTLVLACKNSVIPKNVKKLGNGVFQRRSDLASIEIPEGVKEIGDLAFEDCNALENVKIPSSVEKIGRRAFAGCKKISEITIPASTTKIEAGAFYECDGLKSARFENPKNWKIYATVLWSRPVYLTGDYDISSSRLSEPSSAAKILQTPGEILLQNTKFEDATSDSGIDTEYSCWLQKD